MEIGFKFEVRWSDADVFEIRISAWNGAFGGSTAVYVPIGGLKEAAASIEKTGFRLHPRTPHAGSRTARFRFLVCATEYATEPAKALYGNGPM
jgi:hypothetical protein